MSQKYSYTLLDACQSNNTLHDYPNNLNAIQLGEATNLKTSMIAIQSLQNKRNQGMISEEEFQSRMSNFEDWMSMGLAPSSLEQIRSFIGNIKETEVVKTM